MADVIFLSNDELADLAKLMDRKYASQRQDRTFSCTATQDAKGVYVQVVLKNPDHSFYYPVDGRMLSQEGGLSPKDAALFVIDSIDTYFEEFFMEDGEVLVPIDWGDYDWEGTKFQLRGQILNLKSEQQANQLLGADWTETLGHESLMH